MQCHFVLCVPQSETGAEAGAGKEGEGEAERDMQQMTYLKHGERGAWVD